MDSASILSGASDFFTSTTIFTQVVRTLHETGKDTSLATQNCSHRDKDVDYMGVSTPTGPLQAHMHRYTQNVPSTLITSLGGSVVVGVGMCE